MSELEIKKRMFSTRFNKMRSASYYSSFHLLFINKSTYIDNKLKTFIHLTSGYLDILIQCKYNSYRSPVQTLAKDYQNKRSTFSLINFQYLCT